MQDLKKFGELAKSQLTKATHNKDVEVIYRAEQLLQILTAEAAATQPAPTTEGMQ